MSKVAIIDDSNPAIEYTDGGWSGVNHVFTSTSNEYNSTMHYTFAAGTTIKYTFRGTSTHCTERSGRMLRTGHCRHGDHRVRDH